MCAALTQVGEGNDITGLVVVGTLVGDPYFNLIDSGARGDIWHGRHSILVIVAEEMRKEEVTILIVHIA